MVIRILTPLLVAATLLPICPLTARANPADARISSRVVKATVYTDRAMVTREGKADVTPGPGR